MTRTSLDDAQWTSLMLVIQRIPYAWKRDEAALRRFIEAVLWILRTGAPWRDLPEVFGRWNSAFRRFSRWAAKGVWDRVFAALSDDADFEYLILDSTIVRAHQHAAGAKGGARTKRSGAPAAA